MKKIIGILLLSLIMFSFIQMKMNGYITLFEDSSSAKFYKYGKGNYFETFDNNKAMIGEQEYFVKYRKYSWGTIDTTYYRKGADHYLHINKETLEESVVLPVNPKVGDRWMENDKSWSYEVIKEEQKFKTPAKKYLNCVKVHCKQLTNRDQKKNKEYFLFYSPEFGYVGNVDAKGNILSYLSEVKLNAKQGDVIGGK